MSEITLISMSGKGSELYVFGTSTGIVKCHSDAPNGDFFIKEKINLPVTVCCPVKGRVKIGDGGICQGPEDGSNCQFNHY